MSEDTIKQIAAMLDDAKKTRRYGSIEIELRDGIPVVIREVKTHKIADAGEINRAKQVQRY
ncbi:MAG TPA: hypothetical protein VGH37_10430 [Candidatus Acidoferrum sp.]